MSRLETSKLAIPSLFIPSLLLVLFQFGCDGKDTKRSNGENTAASGRGNSPSSRAGSGNQGAEASGASGGVSSGGGVASAGSNALGVGGASSLPDVDCSSDVECKPYQLLCNRTAAKCVQCVIESDCAEGQACLAGICQVACTSSADCVGSPNGNACDVTTGQCVACVSASDCPSPSTSECVAHACVAVLSCNNSLDCTTASAPICNRATSRCVECLEAVDCTAAGKANAICASNACQTPCATNADCAETGLCNTASSPAVCVECLTNSDCAVSKICTSGVCVAGPGNPGVCADKTAKPCEFIPSFTGIQAVDANGDDFCSVPGFELAFDTSAAKINRADGETAGANYPERATFRVAWSTGSLHAYIEVVDPSVHANTNPDEIWNGDGIELMISTSRSVTGLTSTDANALHLIANSTMAVTVKANGESGTHSQLNEPSQFKAQTTATGYAIELNVPWPAGAAVASGAQIYFDAALNSARAGTDGASPRNAQAILFQLANPVSTSCTGSSVAPFCDDRLWCPTTLQ